MARDAAFWRWYAATNDSIRHEVVERGWFRRETTNDIDERDMPGVVPEVEPNEPNHAAPEAIIDAEYEEVTTEDLYGPSLIEAPEEVHQIEQEQEID